MSKLIKGEVMISKELLSEVLGYKVSKISSDNELIQYWTSMTLWKTINIYELAHKCKEWAIKQDNQYELDSYIGNNNMARCEIYETWHNNQAYGEYEYDTEADTEPEAIFKACEWILQQKELL